MGKSRVDTYVSCTQLYLPNGSGTLFRLRFELEKVIFSDTAVFAQMEMCSTRFKFDICSGTALTARMGLCSTRSRFMLENDICSGTALSARMGLCSTRFT